MQVIATYHGGKASDFSEEEREAMESAFGKQKERLVLALRNKHFSDAYRQAYEYSRWLLEANAWTTAQAIAALEALTISDFLSVGDPANQKARAECLAHGNLDAADARTLLSAVRAALPSAVLTAPQAQAMRAKVGQVPIGTWVSQLENENPEDGNSAIEVQMQGGSMYRDPEMDAVVTLLASAMREPAFDELRTKQQLGYAVFAFKRVILGAAALSVIVQSPRARVGEDGAVLLLDRVDAFLLDFATHLENLSQAELEEYRQAAVSTLLKRPQDLSTLSEQYWAEITSKQFKFDRNAHTAALISAVTHTALRGAFSSLVLDPRSARRLTTLLSPPPAEWPAVLAPAHVLGKQQVSGWRGSLGYVHECGKQ